MNINLVDKTTIKELKVAADWHTKQSKKLLQLYTAEFAKQEKTRAETCKNGEATKLLMHYAYEYLKISVNDDREIDQIKKVRPSTETLLKDSGSTFKTDRPFFNKYFASSWYKINWNTIVDVWFSI